MFQIHRKKRRLGDNKFVTNFKNKNKINKDDLKFCNLISRKFT